MEIEVKRSLLVLLLGLFAVGCYKRTDCEVGDFSQLAVTDTRNPTAAGEHDWLRDAKSCQVGRYRVVAPSKGNGPHLVVIEDGSELPLLSIQSDSALLLSKSKHRATALVSGRDKAGAYHSIVYVGYDALRDAEITVTDSDLDGQADSRTSFFRQSGDRVIEEWWENTWRVVAKRGNEEGYIVGGRFVPRPASDTAREAATGSARGTAALRRAVWAPSARDPSRWPLFGRDCVEGESTRVESEEERKALEDLELDWQLNARSCRLGPYRAIGPVDGSRKSLIIFSEAMQEPVAYADARSLSLGDWLRSVSVDLHPWGMDGEWESLRYDGYDESENAHVSVVDRHIDGQPDWRTWYPRDSRDPHWEVWIADAWRPHVKQGGKYGYLIDGEFVTGTRAEVEERIHAARKAR